MQGGAVIMYECLYIKSPYSDFKCMSPFSVIYHKKLCNWKRNILVKMWQGGLLDLEGTNESAIKEVFEKERRVYIKNMSLHFSLTDDNAKKSIHYIVAYDAFINTFTGKCTIIT